jgi:hypothetical protein
MHKVVRFTLALAGLAAAAIAGAQIPAGLTLTQAGLSPGLSLSSPWSYTFSQAGSGASTLGNADLYVSSANVGGLSFSYTLEFSTSYVWDVAYTGSVPPGTTVVTVEITSPTIWEEAHAGVTCIGPPTPGSYSSGIVNWSAANVVDNISESENGIPTQMETGDVYGSESTISVGLNLNPVDGHFYGVLEVPCRFQEMSLQANSPTGHSTSRVHGEEHLELGDSATLIYSG